MIVQVLKIGAQWLNCLFSGFFGSELSSPFHFNCVLRLWFLVCCILLSFDKFLSDHLPVIIKFSSPTSQLQPKFPSSTQKVSMETPNFNELIERLEKLEIRSQSSVISRKVALGPYDPPQIPAALSSNIAEICQIPEGSSEEAPRPQLSSKLPACELPKFDGHDFSTFVEKFARFLRLSGLQNASEQTKTDWLVQASDPKIYKIVTATVKENQGDLEATLTKLGEIFPTLENDLTVRRKIEALTSLSYAPDPAQLATFLLEFETLLGKLSENSMTDQDKLLHLINKLHPKTFQELRASPVWRPHTDTYSGIKQALTEKVKEDWVDKRLVVTQKNLLAQTEQMQVDSAQTPQSTSYQHQSRSLGKGKGKGKGQGKGGPRGRTPSARTPSRSRSKSQNRFSATIICKWCGKTGHYDDRCFSKYLHLRPPRNPKPPPRFTRYRPENVQTTPQVTFEADPQFNNKKRKINLLSTLALSLGARVNGKMVETIVDSGASSSVVSANLVEPQRIDRSQSVPVQVASGETIFTLGTTTLELDLAGTSVHQTALVLPTNAFQAVLGLDFLCTPPCSGLVTCPEPCRLLYNNREIPLKRVTGKDTYKFYKVTQQPFKTESYTLHPLVKAQALGNLGVDPRELEVDLFANLKNHTRNLFCRKDNSAFKYDWSKLQATLWANPPWTALNKVIHKVCLEPCRMVLTHPLWDDQPWFSLLQKIAIKTHVVEPGTPVFYTDKKKLLPSPLWQTAVTLLDTTQKEVRLQWLDPQVVKSLHLSNRGWGRKELEEAVKL